MKLKECLPKIIELLTSIDSKLGDNTPTEATTSQPEPEIQVKPDAFSESLRPQREFLATVQQDEDIAKILLHRHQQADEATQLLALTAAAAQWERVEEVFDILMQRCKNRQAPADENEQFVLQQCINCHNLIWHNKAAQLRPIADGSTYDYKQHNSGNGQGVHIVSEWLPELVNAGGIASRKALVETR